MLAGRLNGKSRPTGWRPPTNIGTPNFHPVRLLTAKVPELQTQDSFIALANYGKPGEIQGQHALQTRANWIILLRLRKSICFDFSQYGWFIITDHHVDSFTKHLKSTSLNFKIMDFTSSFSSPVPSFANF